MKRLKYIVLGILILIISMFVFLVTKLEHDNSSHMIDTTENNDEIQIYDDEGYFTDEFIEKEFGVEHLTQEEKDLMRYYNNNIHEMLLKMLKPGSEWRCFPVSKSIKDKYNEKEGILADYNFDSIEYSDKTKDLINEYGSPGNISVIGTKNQKKKEIFMTISTNIGLETFEIVKVVDLTDENGNELDTRLRCNEENWDRIIQNFVSQEEIEQDTIAFTNHFKKLYQNCQNVFLYKIPTHKDYSSAVYSIETQEQSNYKNLTAIYRCVKLANTQEKRLYKVHFILDSNQYIDDVDIEVLE